MSDERSTRQDLQLRYARHRYPVDDLTRALADLGCNFGTFMEWPARREANDDPRAFGQANPDHPHAVRSLAPRQDAVAFFWLLAEGDPSLVTDAALAALHRSLFDWSAAVRYDVAMALAYLNRPESGPFLERLIATEPESDNVKEVAQWAYLGHIDSVPRRPGRNRSNRPSVCPAPSLVR